MTHNLHPKTRFAQAIVALCATCSIIAVTTVAATPAQAIIEQAVQSATISLVAVVLGCR